MDGRAWAGRSREQPACRQQNLTAGEAAARRYDTHTDRLTAVPAGRQISLPQMPISEQMSLPKVKQHALSTAVLGFAEPGHVSLWLLLLMKCWLYL